MPTITNKTRRPLAIPLPGGKKLRLGPLKTSKISPKALEHPPIQALVESGDVELSDANTRAGGSSGGAGGVQPSGGHNPAGGVRHTGDR